MNDSGNLLVVYSLLAHPLRGTVRDHLLSFGRYSSRRVFYVNLALHGVPRALSRLNFDAIVFHTSFVSHRWNMAVLERMRERAQPIKAFDGVRVVLPQDEFVHTAKLGEFIEEFEIDVIGTVAPESEWAAIYPDVDRSRVRFAKLLTGYLDDQAARRMTRLGERTERSLDLGYRVQAPQAWLGRHGMLKGELAQTFERAGRERGLRLDIGTRDQDVLLGDSWYRFLASCRYTVGVEGGASLLDPDGSLKARVDEYVARHPEASFEEVEAACFEGRDGELALLALSPRHLEACATRTCQILVEGHYDGVLRAGEHYIELRRDFSNLDAVLDEVAAGTERERLVEAAFDEVVRSGRYSYRRLVEDVERAVFGDAAEMEAPPPESTRARRVGRYFDLRERASWLEVALAVKAMRSLRRAARLLPRPLQRLGRRTWRRRASPGAF